MADSPKEAEAAQALFCAVVDYEGEQIKPIPKDFTAFKGQYGKTMSRVKNKVKTPGISLSQVEKLLNNKSNKWYDSSVNIANQLFVEAGRISKKTHNRIKPKGISLFYVRGDDDVMGSIDKLWKHTNNQVKKRNREERKNDLTFNNLNKWSPADIYLASTKGRMVLKQLSSGKNLTSPLKIGKSKISSLSSLVSFGVLNAVMKQLMENGDLLPLSLKKAPNKDSVIIKTINFISGDVEKALEKNDVRYHGYIFSQTKDVFNSKDVYIKITNKHKLQFRDKGQTGGGLAPKFSYQMVITGGKEALDGSLGGGSIGDVIAQTDAQLGRHFSFASQKNIISSANKISSQMFHEMEVDGELDKSIQNTICDKVYEYAKKFTSLSFGSQHEFYTALYKHPQYGREGTQTKKGVQNAILTQRAIAQFLFGKFMGGRLIEGLLKMSANKRNQTTINFVLYAGSRTKDSSPHVKASDTSSF